MAPIHTHTHTHDHAHMPMANTGSQRVFVIGIALNGAFVIAEVIAGLSYNSMALLTDAGHNLSDVASLLVSLISIWMAKKQSNAIFTYGYKKTTVLAALANAVILLIGIGMIGYESFRRLSNPEPVSGNVIAWVAALGILINGLSAFFFFRQKGELNSKAAYLHLMADALVSLGVVIAGIVISKTHWYWLDPAIGLAVMIIILVSTWGLLRDSFKMSIDAVPSGIELETIKKVMSDVPGVKGVHHVHVWSLSTTENALTGHVLVDDKLNFEEKMKVVAEIKHQLEHQHIHHSTIELAMGSDADKHK
jgi:cobalt-zinc-cadmium efflux system protein